MPKTETVTDVVEGRTGRDGRLYLESGAEFDQSRKYRYRLWRLWDRDLPRLLFIMLNPSRGDAFRLTQTSYLCDDIASWGLPVGDRVVEFGSLEVINLFAYRTPKSKVLESVIARSVQDAIGPENDLFIQDAVVRSEVVVAAWSGFKFLSGRDTAVANLVRLKKPLFRLLASAKGAPYHPYGILANRKRLLREDETLKELVHRSFAEFLP